MTTTTTTTGLDLDAIKARHFAARDGEWKTTTTQEDNAVVYVDHESINGAVTVLFEADWGEVADAEFAAQAHQDVPALVAEVERLTGELAEAETEIDGYERSLLVSYDRLAADGATLKRVKELHSPFKIYGECGHKHEETDEGVTCVEDVDLVCEDGYMYTVCRHCCTSDGDQTEECATYHDHSDSGNRNGFCETRRVLDNAEATDASAGCMCAPLTPQGEVDPFCTKHNPPTKETV